MDDPDAIPGDIPALISSNKELVKSQSDLTTTLKASLNALKERTKALEDEVSNLRLAVEELRAKPDSPSTVPPHPLSVTAHLSPEDAALSAALRVETQRSTLESKAKRFVIMRVPEERTEDGTAAKDQKMLEEIIGELNIPSLTTALENGDIEMHRHPRQRNPLNKQHFRPIKVDVGNPQLRNIVLSKIRGTRLNSLTGFPRTVYCRRDLTEDELRLERMNRARVHEMNTAAGSIVYGMRDTEIVKYFVSLPFAKPRK